MNSFDIVHTNRLGYSMAEITEYNTFGKTERYIRLYKDDKDIIWGFQRVAEESKRLTEDDISEILHEYPNIFGDKDDGTNT